MKTNKKTTDSWVAGRQTWAVLVLACLVMLMCSACLVATGQIRPPAGDGQTYYVSLTGNDANKGITEETAFRTIKKGVSVLHAGDTLIIKSGDYGNDQSVITDSGTKDALITIKAEEPGKVVVNTGGKGAGMLFPSKAYIVVEGIKFTNCSPGMSIRALPWNQVGHASHHITVRKCIFQNNPGNGISLSGGNPGNRSNSHHHLFEQNTFIDNGPKDVQDYGVYMYYSRDVKILNNYFYGLHHQACSFKKCVSNGLVRGNVFEGFLYSAVYLGQNDDDEREDNHRCYNLTVEGNVFRPAKGYRAKRAICVANVSDAIVRNNFIDSIYGDHTALQVAANSTGAKVHGNFIIGVLKEWGVELATSDCEFYNNTVAECDIGLAIIKGANPLIRNNIFYKNKQQVRILPTRIYKPGKQGDHGSRFLPDKTQLWTWQPDHAREPLFEHNNFFPQWDGMGKTDISVDPKFAGPFTKLKAGQLNPKFIPNMERAQAYSLTKSSPCIDKGLQMALPLSYSGAAPDLGAFEVDQN
ncbi:MAG: right-handed parallel beta-helix repeat-containing protein [Planctomycetota bacterium]|nr:right-handed parallel beta-helix repeat-containing protein [Planctomycetota bacterium]